MSMIRLDPRILKLHDDLAAADRRLAAAEQENKALREGNAVQAEREACAMVAKRYELDHWTTPHEGVVINAIIAGIQARENLDAL